MSAYDVSFDDLLKVKWMFEQQQKIAHFGTWECDLQNNQVEWSDESYKIYGLPPGFPLNYEIVADFRHPDDYEKVEKNIIQAIEEKSSYDIKYRIIRKNGEIRYIHGHGKVFTDDQGIPQKIFGTMQDITELKLLHQDQAVKANLLSAVNEAIIAIDNSGILKYINKKAEEAYRIKADELVGRSYTELIKRAGISYPAQEVSHKLAATGSSVYELRFETDDGCKWHEVHSKSVSDDAGEFIGVVCAARDVTHRKASEATIKRQNTILKQINMIYKHAISCDTVQSLGKMCISIIEKVTDSELSFIGEVGLDGEIRLLASNAPHWDLSEHIQMFNSLKTCDSSVMINEMSRFRLSKIHPQIRSMLLVPYLRGDRLGGFLCAANRQGGYDAEQKELIEALAPSIFETLTSKCASEHLRENELLMRTIMDSASDFLFLKDRDSRVVMVNQAYKRVFHVDNKDVVGKNDFELYPDADYAAQVIENDRQVMETGKTLICQESAMTADGFKTYSLSKVPWRDINGDIIGVLGVAHDVTELNETKESLSRMVTSLKYSNEYIELLYEITGKILSSTAPRKDIDTLCEKVMRFLECDVFFNYLHSEGEACMHLNAYRGLSLEKMKEIEYLPVGASVCGYVLQHRCRIVAESIQDSVDPRTDLVKSLGIRAYACYPIMADNEIFGTLSFGTRRKDSFKQEELILMKTVAESIAVSIRRKIKEEKIVEQAKELEIKNKLITDFFINVSHEFKTPLSIMKLAAELIDHSFENGRYDKIGSYIGMVRSNSNRLTKLVGNLLDMTKVDAGFMAPRRSWVDIVVLIDSIMQQIRLYASKRALSVDFISEVKSCVTFTDSSMIERIVLNLLSNAIKHTPRGGCISLELQNCNGTILIAVKDNGEGIPDDKKEVIFDRFRQANSSLARSSEGCGIGLALSKSLAELLGGRIWLESELGKGSSFFVELPFAHTDTEKTVVIKTDNIENNVMIELSDISFT